MELVIALFIGCWLSAASALAYRYLLSEYSEYL